MKDLSTKIRDGYLAKLSGISVDVFDQTLPRGSDAKNYVLITEFEQDSERTKDCFKPICTQQVEVFVRTINTTGKKACDEIANEVLELINPISSSNYISAGAGFQVVLTKVILNKSMHLLSGAENIYRRIIRFEHKVVEENS